jgi:hypothetical protein
MAISTSPRTRWATCQGAFLSLISGPALKRVKPSRWAKPNVHGRRPDRCAVLFGPYGHERCLDILNGRPAQVAAGGHQRVQEAVTGALVGADRMRRAKWLLIQMASSSRSVRALVRSLASRLTSGPTISVAAGVTISTRTLFPLCSSAPLT